MKTLRTLWFGLFFFAALCCISLRAHAAGPPGSDPKKEAAALSADGAAKFDENDFLGALDAFSRAYAIYPVPTIGVFVARCQHALGRHAAALRTYDKVLLFPVDAETPKQVKTAMDEARSERQDLLQSVAFVNVQVTGATSFTILIDGVEAPFQTDTKYPVDPGPHVFTAKAAGFADATQRVDAVATQEQVLTLALVAGQTPAPVVAPVPSDSVFQGPTFSQDKYAKEEAKRKLEQEEARKQKEEADRKAKEAEKQRLAEERKRQEREERDSETLSRLRRPYIIPGYIVSGVGVVGLIISGVSYSSASDSKEALDRECVGMRCPASSKNDLESAKSSADMATYTLIGGAVVTAVGAAWLIRGYTLSLPEREGAWNLTVGPGTLNVGRTY